MTKPLSLTDRMSAVQTAVSKRFNATKGSGGIEPAYAWAEVVYEDHVILRKDSKLFRLSYTLDKGEVLLADDLTEVRVSYVTMQEGAIIGQVPDALAEGATSAAPTGRQWAIVVIEEGLSRNRAKYSRAVLEEAAHLYENRPIYADHPEQPRRFGRSTRDVVGFIRDVRPVALRTESASTGRFALAATACITDPTVRQQMLEAFEMGNASLFQFSHAVEADSKVVRGSDGPYHEVTAIKKVLSVDLVTEAAAGGRTLTLVASTSTDQNPVLDKDAAMLERLIAAIKQSGQTALVQRLEAFGDTPTEDQVLGLYQEAVKASVGNPSPGATATTLAPAPQPGSIVIQEAVIVDLKKDALQLFAENTVNGTALPDAVKTHLRQTLTSRIHEAVQVDALPTRDAITKAVQDQVTLFGQLAEANIVLPANGRPHVQVVKDRRDKFVEALDEFFDPSKPVRSFRSLYADLTGDKAITGRIEEATILRESLTTTSFGEIFGDSVTRRMLSEYQLPAFATWRGTVAEVVPLNDMRTQRRIRFGGYPNLPTVAQGAAYTALTSPTDEEATYTPAKRGGTEDLTLEMILNDDVGAIRRIPQRLGRAAAQTLYEFVFDFMATNAVIYDTVALAAAGHGNNIVTTALSAANLTTLRNRIKVQPDMSNGKRLGLAARHLFLPIELEELGFQLTTSDKVLGSANNDPNFVRKLGITPIVVDYWTDANNYWVTADPSQTPMIEIGFLNGREEPELFLQDQPTVGSMFSNDKLTYKIRHIYGGGVMDYRGFAAGIVA